MSAHEVEKTCERLYLRACQRPEMAGCCLMQWAYTASMSPSCDRRHATRCGPRYRGVRDPEAVVQRKVLELCGCSDLPLARWTLSKPRQQGNSNGRSLRGGHRRRRNLATEQATC